MHACSALEAFCRGEEDELLSVKKVRFVGGMIGISTVYSSILISEGIRNKECNKSASFYGCYITLCPWLRLGRKLKGYGP